MMASELRPDARDLQQATQEVEGNALTGELHTLGLVGLGQRLGLHLHDLLDQGSPSIGCF